ncbi:MAG: glycosyltransferase family 2 protein [Solirubrobacteraceae bacterium]
MTPPEASIVIATARDGARLTAALDRLPSTLAGVACELIVVLNGAAQDVIGAARARTDIDHLLESEANLGFAGATNLGARAATGEFVVLLHDDTEPVAGWLARLLETVREHPQIGVIGPLTLRRDGTVQVAGATLTADGSPWAPAQGCAPDDPAVGTGRATDYCGSNAVVVRRAAWEAIGGLEEALFPAGYVDVDLAFSARRAGWEVWFEPRAAVVHEGGHGTLAPGFRAWVAARNRAVFTEKWAAALEAFEPADPGDIDGTIARAVERARQRRPDPGPLPSAAAPRPSEVALLHAYVGEQDAWAAGVHREWPRLAAEIAALQGALAAAGEQTRGQVETIATLDAEVQRLREREAFLDAECGRLARLGGARRSLRGQLRGLLRR